LYNYSSCIAACQFSTVRKCKELIWAAVYYHMWHNWTLPVYLMFLNWSNNTFYYSFWPSFWFSIYHKFNRFFSKLWTTKYHHDLFNINYSGNYIFFSETSGEHCLTPYWSCSIQSAKEANPRSEILIYMEENRHLIQKIHERYTFN